MRSMLKRKRTSTFRRHPSTPRTNVSRSDRAASGTPCLHATSRQSSSSFTGAQLRTPFQTEAHPEAADSDGFTGDDVGHVISAVDMKDTGTVGCAYYSSEEETLYLLGDIRSSGMEAIDACEIPTSFHKF